jgi:hypothetical protein
VWHLVLGVGVEHVDREAAEVLVALGRLGLGQVVGLVRRDVLELDDAVLILVALFADAIEHEAAAGDQVAVLVDHDELDEHGLLSGVDWSVLFGRLIIRRSATASHDLKLVVARIDVDVLLLRGLLTLRGA